MGHLSTHLNTLVRLRYLLLARASLRITKENLRGIAAHPSLFPSGWWLALKPTAALLVSCPENCLESYLGSDGKALGAAIMVLLHGTKPAELQTLCGNHARATTETGLGSRARVRFISFGEVPAGVTPLQCCYARNPLPPALGREVPPDPRLIDGEERDAILERLAPKTTPIPC